MSRLYRVKEFAERIRKSTSTLRRWDKEGKLVAKRSAGGHRYYDESDVRKALGIELSETDKKTIVYCRVSSRSQLPDLKSQVQSMRMFCLGAGIAVDEWLEEISGGMNFKRKVFLNLFDRIERGEITKLIIAHKDRLVRFGFDFFEGFAAKHDCEIVVVNQEQLSPQEEMVQDLMAIIHCFSSRLYGLRNFNFNSALMNMAELELKKKIKEAAETNHG
ncbi:MAG: IS607 family transposase [Candidatus Poribacteria bacterium]|nr:IS607 family transposase [Candidatus Poribacteria bacterium]